MTNIIRIITTNVATTLILLSNFSYANSNDKVQLAKVAPQVSRVAPETQFKASDFRGVWQASLFQRAPDGRASVSASGAINYLTNGKSTAEMKIVVSGVTTAGQPFKLYYQLTSNGTWSVTGNSLTETITSIQGGLYKMQTGPQIVELSRLPAQRRDQILASSPKIKELIPLNVPDILIIGAVSRTRILLRNKTGGEITLTRKAPATVAPPQAVTPPVATQQPATPPAATQQPAIVSPSPVTPAPAKPAPITPDPTNSATVKPPVSISNKAATPATTANFVGSWNARLMKKDPANGNLITLTGTITYKADNTFSTSIVINISGINSNIPFALTYNLWTKGTWGVSNNVLTETITDVKSVPVIVKNGERTITISALPADQQKKIIASLPNMNTMFPKNTPEASKILKVSANKLRINSDGEPYTLKRVVPK